MATVTELIQEGRALLQGVSDTPQLDSEVLLGHVLQQERLWLLSHSEDPVLPEQEREFQSLVQLRKEHAPIAYLTGKREFYGRTFEVTKDVLIPRPETELLVETALKHLRTSEEPRRVLELGVGSGCIICSLAAEFQIHVEYFASDLSEGALRIASKNAASLKVGQFITFFLSNWFEEVPELKFDLILSNPPYVEGEASLAPHVLKEPHAALFAEDSGLSELKLLLKEGKKFLNVGGRLLLECGAGQWPVLSRYIEEIGGYKARAHADLQGIPRVLDCLYVAGH